MTNITTSRTGTPPASEMDRVRPRRRARLVGTLLVAAGWGVIAGWWTPRGPITTVQALAAIAVSLAVGALAGGGCAAAGRCCSRRSSSSPCSSSPGPAPPGRWWTTSGSAAARTASSRSLLGRGIHAVLALVPMALGAALGAGCAPRTATARGVRAGGRERGWSPGASAPRSRWWPWRRWPWASVRPASTDAILDRRRRPAGRQRRRADPRRVGGHDLAMMIRGDSTDKPGAAVPGRRSRRDRTGRDAPPRPSPGEGLRGGHLGPARHRQVLRPPSTPPRR